jgi:Uma2 family endonuclease
MQRDVAVVEWTVPETKPATEWILGEAVQKVSPRRSHALVQCAMAQLLRTWARGRGECGLEWRFRITPPGGPTRPLVPDLAFLSNERAAGLSGEDREVPPVAPDIVVEILSPEDRADRVASKREVYLAAGTRSVLIFDPRDRTLDAFTPSGHTRLTAPAVFASEAFPGLEIDLAALFGELDT